MHGGGSPATLDLSREGDQGSGAGSAAAAGRGHHSFARTRDSRSLGGSLKCPTDPTPIPQLLDEGIVSLVGCAPRLEEWIAAGGGSDSASVANSGWRTGGHVSLGSCASAISSA